MRAPWLVGPIALALAATGAMALGRTRVAPPALPNGAAIRELDIAFFERRVADDPSGAMDLVRLGGLYLERFRAAGNEADLVAAEAAARRSLGNRAGRDGGARQLLTAALLGQHRFVEAQAEAQRLVGLDPEDPVARATLGEVRLELGDYPGADSLFGSL